MNNKEHIARMWESTDAKCAELLQLQIEARHENLPNEDQDFIETQLTAWREERRKWERLWYGQKEKSTMERVREIGPPPGD